MLVTQHYFNHEWLNKFIRVVFSIASFPSDWMRCLYPHCLCTVILINSVVLRISLLFLFWIRRLPFLGRRRVDTHTHKENRYFSKVSTVGILIVNWIIDCKLVLINFIFIARWRCYILNLFSSRVPRMREVQSSFPKGQPNLTQRCKRFTIASTSTQVAVLPWRYDAEKGTAKSLHALA